MELPMGGKQPEKTPPKPGDSAFLDQGMALLGIEQKGRLEPLPLKFDIPTLREFAGKLEKLVDELPDTPAATDLRKRMVVALKVMGDAREALRKKPTDPSEIEALRKQIGDLGRALRQIHGEAEILVAMPAEPEEEYIWDPDAFAAEQKALIEKSQREKVQTRQRQQGPVGDPDANNENADDPTVPGNVDFPHNGKHRCPAKLNGYEDAIVLKTIEQETSGQGEDAALYKTTNAKKVVTWEKRAMKYGLLLSNNFNHIHWFNFIVGADQGARTHAVRIDGDHGHPIHETQSKTSFLAYLQGEFAEVATLAKTNMEAARARLEVLLNYLRSINYDARALLNFVPPELRKS